LYSKIQVEVKPSQLATKVDFTGAFDSDFVLILRETRATPLARMQDDVIEIESNMMASGKLKRKVELGIREPRRFKEQGGPFGSGRNTQDEKIKEMDKIIKYLSNKISKIEMEKAKPEPYVRNQNQLRRNLNTNLKIQQRQIKNEDQKI
jgi:hypothetical protein